MQKRLKLLKGILCFSFLILQFSLFAQDNVGKQSTQMTKSPKEVAKERKAINKIHEHDKNALSKQFSQKSKYKKDHNYKVPKNDKTKGM